MFLSFRSFCLSCSPLFSFYFPITITILSLRLDTSFIAEFDPAVKMPEQRQQQEEEGGGVSDCSFQTGVDMANREA